MDHSRPPQEHQTNVFSISDKDLSDKLHFVEEIGFGNWGSVWLCCPKKNPLSPSADGLDRLQDSKIAVKLVHRSKTPTTAARVRSLWNEMKIVRAFKNDPHPSIIPFHSFIITPSYALITMAFLPTLIPVEVEEPKSKEWFRSLLSGVEFLHRRGVVHNDIKPANILLSHDNIPVLVDFGFAEKYNIQSSRAFHSNLSYGTPEYLSPERSRGLPHDTRKSDVWSLGITFFEILIGRTPFEYSDTEQFTTKEELEKYWSRTLRGKWVGSWKMSKSIEKLLRRMIAPNADLRCTTSAAMADPYWRKDEKHSHKRSASSASSIVLEDMSKLMNKTAPWLSRSSKGKMNAITPGKCPSPVQQVVNRSKSHPKLSFSKSQIKRPTPLSPVFVSPSSRVAKENVPAGVTTRKRIASREPLSHSTSNNATSPIKPSPEVSAKEKEKHRKRALMDLTGIIRNSENRGKEKNITSKTKGSVDQRMKEWERERERLREMSQLEERREEVEREREREKKKMQERTKSKRQQENQGDEENTRPSFTHSRPRVGVAGFSTPLDVHNDTFLRLGKEWALNGFKHSMKTSVDRAMELCKTSTLQPANAESSVDKMDDEETRKSYSERESWEDDGTLRGVKFSHPVARHAIRNDHDTADNRQDRMVLWVKNVEKVVEDARQTFASTTITPLPPLPIGPSSHSATRNASNRNTRLPRKVLTANQIFSDGPEHGSLARSTSLSTSSTHRASASPARSHGPNQVSASPRTPQRTRRATVSTRSPEPAKPNTTLDVDTGSPPKRKEKSKSHGNLMQPISSLSFLELELKKKDVPTPLPRLSTVLDRSLFILPPVSTNEDASVPSITLSTRDKSTDYDELTSSPFIVEPYPPRKVGAQEDIPDTPTQRRLEGVYDRFLMATSGVKRLGRGYQSDNVGPVSSNPDPRASHRKRSQRHPQTSRIPMPPPVASSDQKQKASVDELGVLNHRQCTPDDKDDGNTTVAIVRRAFKAMMTGKPSTRRTP